MGDTLGKLFVDVDSLPDNGFGFVQLVFLGLAYAYILFNASNLISEGSELLLLVPSLAGIVGSVVLPILGAVPDGAIVLFSGMGPADKVQEQLAVGIGALAGSSSMLLTLTLGLSIYAGRVDLDSKGVGNYKPRRGASKLTDNAKGLFTTGVNVRDNIAAGGNILALTGLGFVIILIPSLLFGCAKTDSICQKDKEKWYAFAGFLFTTFAFCGYLWYQVRESNSRDHQEKIDEARAKAIQSGTVSLTGAFAAELLGGGPGEAQPLMGGLEAKRKRLEVTLRKFFCKYDKNKDNTIDAHEFADLLKDIGEKSDPGYVKAMLSKLDPDGDGSISFSNFSNAMQQMIASSSSARRGTLQRAGFVQADTKTDEEAVLSGGGAAAGAGGEDEGEDSGEEEEDIPEDLEKLSPAEQQKRIKMRSMWMMGLGTFIVLLFSDPMVDVLSELGKRLGISGFYVAFVLAPLASNASELIASYSYALKKTTKTISISVAALQGAGCMNNTFCLAIFLLLVFAKELAWEFTAETIGILVVELAICWLSHKRTLNTFHAYVLMLLFPLSIVLVAVLEKAGLN